jgi:hypothetical protein
MPPRRREREMPDPAVEREMRELRARLDAMETTQRHTIDVGDINEDESENEAENEGEEVAVEDAAEERLFKVVARIGAREKMDIPMYEGNLDVEEILDWIRDLDKYFDYEDVEEDKKVKHVVTRLKGHATLWWDELQADRHCKGKQKIKSWDRMVAKMKAKFIDPGGYWWPPTYSTWTHTIVSFSFSVSLIVAQFTIFSSSSGPELPELF